MLWIFESKFSGPHDAVALEFDRATLERLLSDPEEIPADDEHGKDAASALCGARYFPSATTRDKEGVEAVTCLVVDVDCPRTPSGTVPDEAALRDSLAGLRYAAYSSPSHTAESPRWRVLLPLLAPLPPKKHRALVAWLSDNLVTGYPGCIDVESTGDPCRLGFVGVTKHPRDYTWWLEAGATFDWSGIPLDDEVWVDAPLGGLERSALWSDRHTALKRAQREYAAAGQGLRHGGGRSNLLWHAAMDLWWCHAAEDEDFVLTVLSQVNANFAEAEDDDEIARKCREAHQRTVGEKRVPQHWGHYGCKREPQVFVSVDTIRQYAKKLKQRRDPQQAEVGAALLRLSRGETLSDDPVTWKALVTRCAHRLAEAFSSQPPERIAEFFRPSLATMRAAGSASVPEEGEVTGYIASRVESVKRQREQSSARVDARVREDIALATRGARDARYTAEEVEGWTTVGLSPRTWILSHQRSSYIFNNGTWVGPFGKDDFDVACSVYLAAASDFIQLRKFNDAKQEWVDLPPAEVRRRYGMVVDETRVDFMCEETYYRPDDNVLVLAGPPRRKLQPHFHEDVDQWVRVLTGRETGSNFTFRTDDDGRPFCTGATWTTPTKRARLDEASGKVQRDDAYDAVCDWLAGVLLLDRPSAALYLQGVHSVGKGLFANGVGNVWRRGPIGIEEAFADFNAPLLQTPFVWVDEALPENVRVSVLLRKALAAHEHRYQRKFVDAGEVVGCVRMLFTANNNELFQKANEHLRRADVDALSLRFVHVECKPEAAWYLHTISPRHREFVTQNRVAEHVLWLVEQRSASVVAKDKRFLVSAANRTVSDAVAVGGDVVGECLLRVCQQITACAKSVNGVPNTPEWLVVKEGRVVLNTKGLFEDVALVARSNLGRTLTAVGVSRALDGVVDESVVEWHPSPRVKKNVRGRTLQLSMLRQWCLDNDLFDWAEVEAAVQKLSAVAAAVAPGPGSSGSSGSSGPSGPSGPSGQQGVHQ